MEHNVVIGSVLAALGSIGGVVWTYAKIKKSFKEEIREDLKPSMENIELKLKGLANEIKHLDEKLDQEIAHVKATYNNEIKHLGDKIEGLREELRYQTGQILELLTKMVDK